MRSALAAGKQMKVTAANGTDITFGVDVPKAFVSDGAITPENVKRGGSAPSTRIPAGELLVPVTLGSAEGKVVVDKVSYNGKDIIGLTLTIANGKVTAMTATSGIEELKARYDAAGANKDQFSFIDLGLNPEAKISTGSGAIVWMAPGGITVGIGDNTGWGGSNVSDFTTSLPISGVTVTVDGKPIIGK